MIFKGKVFCCTAIPTSYRSEIDKYVKELGGHHFSNLTSDVQYLIVGNRNTDKFNFCLNKRDDITYLKFNAIHEFYEGYKAGKSVDLNEYVLGVFDLLTIAISHIKSDDLFIDNLDLQKVITSNGGQLSKTLTTNSACLITNIKTGKRYAKALEWEIPVVHPIYISHSLTRGLALPFEDYLLDKYPDYAAPIEAPITTKTVSTAKSAPTIHNPTNKIKKTKIDVWNSIMNTKSHEIKLPNSVPKPTSNGIFKGLKFKLLFFNADQKSILNEIITKNEGTITENESESDFKLIPFGNEGISGARTEWLIERSIFYGRLTVDIWSEPTPPINLPKNKTITLSGFTGVEDLHIKKLLAHKGFEIVPKFNAKTSILLININIFQDQLPKSLFEFDEPIVKCPFNSINIVSTKNKIQAAKKWGIPIVSARYAFEVKYDDADNIDDTKWCLYYKPSDKIPSDSPDSGSLKLPSPKKIKRKFGKLVTNNEKVKGIESEGTIDDLDFDLGIGYGKKQKRG
ncbi:hypothetical protein CLIB1444_07S07712 [[Candida] jaroonii]|uniref:Uncharacterized protein n=1 Tax=[Candida] jaroonii TaxID=467808 RepID=A0ACA9YAU4_9ASCO|nr:hypothetical protein CLIB1444_07S07712 [[Candida] jaroonii]